MEVEHIVSFKGPEVLPQSLPQNKIRIIDTVP